MLWMLSGLKISDTAVTAMPTVRPRATPPVTYLGGIFYSISLLPDFWERVSLVNPILYMVNAFRYGFLGITDISLWLSYLISISFIVGLYLFSLYLLRTGYGIRT